MLIGMYIQGLLVVNKEQQVGHTRLLSSKTSLPNKKWTLVVVIKATGFYTLFVITIGDKLHTPTCLFPAYVVQAMTLKLLSYVQKSKFGIRTITPIFRFGKDVITTAMHMLYRYALGLSPPQN